MRILHLSSEYPPQRVYGLGRYVCDLSRALAKDHAVHVLTNSIGGTDQDADDQGVHLHRVDYPPPPKPPGEIAPVMAFNLHLQQRALALGFAGLGSPEVLVSHDWLTALAGERIARRFQIPHVWTVHDTMVGKSFGRLDDRDSQHIEAIEQWAGQAADLVLANSRAIQEELHGHYQVARNKTRILHCAIDPERYAVTTSAERLAEFRRVFAKPDELLLTYVGRLDHEKGIDTLINAVAAVRQRSPQLRLAIVGTGSLDETIRDHLAKLQLASVVRLYGYLKPQALAHLYRISDLHVCPSHYEPFGIVAAEAMAAGAPVIASATGGLCDLISSPTVGCLVPPRNAEALAAAMVTLAQDPESRKRLGAAGAAHVGAHFSWPVLAARAAAFYREAADAASLSRIAPPTLQVAAGAAQ